MISIIAAMGENRELGLGNKLPWHLPDDLKRFKELTRGHMVIMGRKTHESIGKPLPDRENIIITRDQNYKAPDCVVVNSMEEAVGYATEEMIAGREVFVIGGGEIYKLAMRYANKMYLTVVDARPPADVYFPEFDEKEWHLVANESHGKDEKHAYAWASKVYERKT